MAKEQAQTMVEELPEDVPWDERMYELYVRQKVESAQEAVEDGKVVPHAEAQKRVARR